MSLLQLSAEYDFSITKFVALESAAEYFNSLGLTLRLEAKWLNSFIKRQSEEITCKKQENLERARTKAFTEHVRADRFNTLKGASTNLYR